MSCPATPAPSTAASTSPSRPVAVTAPKAGTALHTAYKAYKALAADPQAPVIDGSELGYDLPGHHINVTELNRILFHPSTSADAIDAVWRHLAQQSRTLGGSWTIAAIGVAMPNLRSMSASLAGQYHGDRAEIDDELLIGFLDALATIDVAGPRVFARLCGPAYTPVRHTLRREHAARTARRKTGRRSPDTASDIEQMQQVLDYAVEIGVLSGLEADVISQTRLRQVSLDRYATNTGRQYNAVAQCRSRGEKRFKTAYRNGELENDAEVIWKATTTTVYEDSSRARRNFF